MPVERLEDAKGRRHVIVLLAARLKILVFLHQTSEACSMAVERCTSDCIRQWMEYLLVKLASPGCLKIAKTIGRWRWRWTPTTLMFLDNVKLGFNIAPRTS